MNPADEFDAFATIAKQQRRQGSTEEDAIAYVARRFGVTVKHVQGRLRLASLAPEILEALRAGKISLDIAKAYAGSTDHAVQLQVFKAVAKVRYPLVAKDIRNRLRGVTCALDDWRMQFVGLDAYRAAGGRTEAEMFMGTDGEERALDVALLEKLATAKGEEAAAAAAKVDGWKSGVFTLASAYTVKKPDGFSLIYHGADQVAKTKRKKCIAIYGVDNAGIQLEAFFQPAEPVAKAEQRDWQAEREAEAREREITVRAARLAVGPFAGSPPEGRAYWPRYHSAVIEPDPTDPGFRFLAVQIRIPVADIEAQREEALRLIAEEAAAAAAEEAEGELDDAEAVAEDADT